MPQRQHAARTVPPGPTGARDPSSAAGGPHPGGCRPRDRYRTRVGPPACGRPRWSRRPSVPGYRRRPGREPGVHRLQPLAGPLVGVGHDPLLTTRERRPATEGSPSASRVTGWARRGERQLGVALSRQPCGRALTMREDPGRIVGRQDLVDVVEQCRRLDRRRSTASRARRSARQPARHLGDGTRVRDEPRWGIQGEQQ